MRNWRVLAALLAAGGLALLLALLLGSTPLGPGRVLLALFGQGERADILVVQSIRLPRSGAAFLTGGALGLSGAALQGLLRNPLAEPGVLGVTAAAIFGATGMIYFGLAGLSPLIVSLGAAGGAVLATAFIALLAVRLRSVTTLLLVGIGLSSFIGALMSLTLSLAPTPFTMAEMVNWSFGSVANRSWRDIGFSAPFMAAGALLIALARRGFSVLLLGEEAASSLGLDLARHRLLTVGGAGLLTGGAVALSGGIGFVGIVAPHLVRPLTGHDPARSLLPSFLLGGVILLLADLFIRLFPSPLELKLGVVAALIGAPVFVLIAAGRGRAGA